MILFHLLIAGITGKATMLANSMFTPKALHRGWRRCACPRKESKQTTSFPTASQANKGVCVGFLGCRWGQVGCSLQDGRAREGRATHPSQGTQLAIVPHMLERGEGKGERGEAWGKSQDPPCSCPALCPSPTKKPQNIQH
jgi:hypothetical protein